MYTHHRWVKMADIEIKRGYEVLPDNNIRFGIRITNISDVVISDVEVILDYSESLFKLEGERVQKVGVIPPASTRTAEFILKPLGCVHKVHIEALISYRDTKYARQRIDMHPKEVHCVCPFLKGKPMSRAEFLDLSGSGHSAESGLNFKGVSVERLASYLVQTCKSRHHKVDDYSVDGGRMLYLASESIGEKAYYLLTALIKDDGGLTQVMLRVASDKPHGLNGFLNEIVADLRHVASSVQSAQEIGVIKKEQVINIIDSIVQRSSFGGSGGEGEVSVNIQDSVVQRTEFNAGEDGKAEEERLRKEKEQLESERKEKEKIEELRKQKEKKAQEYTRHKKDAHDAKEHMLKEARDAEEHMLKHRRKVKNISIVLLGVLLIFFIAGSGDVNDASSLQVEDEPDVSTPLPSFDQKTRTNSIGMEFVSIPAGEFMMGSPSDEDDSGWDDGEGPLHKVTISNEFYLGKYEVTQKQWHEIMGNNPSYFTGDDRPVEQVSWNDVQKFIEKLNEKEGTDKYRLPSEAEWEYACRAGTTTRYSFGDDKSMLSEYAWYSDYSGDGTTHTVGQKKPNPWGLYDMHGNVYEWTQDKWYYEYDGYDGAPTDGSAWESGSSVFRIHRGGDWYYGADSCRSASRGAGAPDDRRDGLGFRLLQES